MELTRKLDRSEVEVAGGGAGVTLTPPKNLKKKLVSPGITHPLEDALEQINRRKMETPRKDCMKN